MMSLPEKYPDSKAYFQDSLRFLKKYQWLYNYPNTHILVFDVFKHIPTCWLPYLKNLTNEQLNDLSSGKVGDDCPDSLKLFAESLASLTPVYSATQSASNKSINQLKNSKMLRISDKKRHEILSFAPLIDMECSKRNIEHIIDVGVGLGYLSEILNSNYKYKILGLEGSEEKRASAARRQDTYNTHYKDDVKYITHYVTLSSGPEIEALLSSHFPEHAQTAIVGLHACADLSITVLKLFLELKLVKLLIIMPCCYHRLEISKETETTDEFANFPISESLRETYKKYSGCEFLRRYFLRLACQETVERFRNMSALEHEKQAKSCLFRAVLEDCAREVRCQVKRLKRKTGPSIHKSGNEDFESYVNNLKSTHQLSRPDLNNSPMIDSSHFKTKMFEKWEIHKENFWLVEVLLGLQTAIQSICENLVLLDRIEFLKEMGIDCFVCKVTDDCISPRCHALVATRA